VSSRSHSVSALSGPVQAILEPEGQSPAPVVPFAGLTATGAHSIVAKNNFEQIVSCNPIAAQDESLRTALTSLQRLVGMLRMGASTSFHGSGVSDSLPVPDNEYPSWQTICSIFHHATGKISLRTSISIDSSAKRSALQTVQELGEKKQLLSESAWSSYLHWVTMNTPFTPFTVMFSHVIANYRESEQDLRLLQGFVNSLEHVATLSEGIGRFHQLCSTFYQVAEAYTSAKNREDSVQEANEAARSQQQGVLLPTLEEIDECLAILDYAQPPLFETGYDGTGTTDIRREEQSSSCLYDWYAGNASLVGLMEFGFD
jgi:hypothetical protein